MYDEPRHEKQQQQPHQQQQAGSVMPMIKPRVPDTFMEAWAQNGIQLPFVSRAAVKGLWRAPAQAADRHGSYPAAAGISSMRQQIASAAVSTLAGPSSSAAAAAGAAASPAVHLGPSTRHGPVMDIDFWSPVVSAAAASIAAAAGATDMPPAAAAMPGLETAAKLAVHLAARQAQATARADLCLSIQDTAADLSGALDEAVPTDAFDGIGQVLDLSIVEAPVLHGKLTVLLGTRGQGTFAHVHVGLAAAPNQIIAASTAVGRFGIVTANAVQDISDAAAEGGMEKALNKCANLLAAAAQSVVAAVPGAVLVAVKVWKGAGVWPAEAQHEVEILQVLNSDSETKELVPELLAVGKDGVSAFHLG